MMIAGFLLIDISHTIVDALDISDVVVWKDMLDRCVNLKIGVKNPKNAV